MKKLCVLLFAAMIIVAGCGGGKHKVTAKKKSTTTKKQSVSVDNPVPTRAKDAKIINFSDGLSFEKMEGQAQTQNKPMFMVFTTRGCAPCKMMEEYVFTLPDVAQFFNANYLSYKIDGEKGDGKKIVAKYEVNFYPTIIYTNSKGEGMRRFIGSMPGSELKKHGEEVLKEIKN